MALSRRAARLAVLACALVLVACATPPGALPADRAAPPACVDAAATHVGVRDAEAAPVPGFPGLRVDRVGQALRARAAEDPTAFGAWLDRAARLHAEARAAERANLPSQASSGGDGPVTDVTAGSARDAACHRAWQARLQDDPEARARLLDAAQVPDRYDLRLRAVGLYPLLRWPFFVGVQGWQRAQTEAMARWAADPPRRMRYLPPPSSADPAPPSATDALGLPVIDAAHAAQLLARHAPVVDIEAGGPDDLFGAPHWGGGDAPEVDTRTPVVYARIAHARDGHGRWLTQLVYSLWFPSRPSRGPLDLLAGRLDGVMLRLTLAPDGRTLMLDSIHACGCYHQFLPGDGVVSRGDAPFGQEWAFVPARLPLLTPGERLVVGLTAGTHQLGQVGTLATAPAPPSPGTHYELRDERQLRSLPLTGGGRRSLYGPDGLVPGTERGERWLFWPMGIASAGAQRQWGHHATAFVGRRHFDDPDLLATRFQLRPAR